MIPNESAPTHILMRIFIDEDERLDGQPLYVSVVKELQRQNFAGATVLKGIEGYRAKGQLHAARAFDYSSNLPILIEVIETSEKIETVLPRLREMIPNGLLTTEKIQIAHVGAPPDEQ